MTTEPPSFPPAAPAPSAPSSDPNWFIPCAEEELYREAGKDKGQMGAGQWRPKTEEVLEIYGRITAAKDGVLPLQWGCPYGKRPPSPNEDEEYETDEEEAAAQAAAQMGRAKIGSAAAARGAGGMKDGKGGGGFDFDDEDMGGTPAATTPSRMITPRRTPGTRELKGSAKKKTTDFNSVVSNMRRHKQMDAARAKSGTPKK